MLKMAYYLGFEKINILKLSYLNLLSKFLKVYNVFKLYL